MFYYDLRRIHPDFIRMVSWNRNTQCNTPFGENGHPKPSFSDNMKFDA